jgi:tetratricopeptide (TPR) repeat protein
MATRRITRKEMNRDDFVSAMGRFSIWMEDHVKEALLIGGGVLAVAIGSIVLVQYTGQRELKASALLGRGLEILHAPLRGAANPGTVPSGFATEPEKLNAALVQFDSLLQTYPRSRSGRLALYYKGLVLQGLGRNPESLKSLQEFLDADPKNYAAPMARATMARIWESTGERQKALDTYEALSRDTSGAYPPDAALFEMARCLEGMGKKDEARKVYERVAREFPESDYSREAQDKLKQSS